MSDIRLCTVDGNGIITRCFWGDESRVNGTSVRIAPEPWAVEGANYDAAKAAHEAYLGSDQQQSDLAQKDLEANKVYRTIFEYLFLTINDVRALQRAAGQNAPAITRVQLRNSMIDFYKSLGG